MTAQQAQSDRQVFDHMVLACVDLTGLTETDATGETH